MKDKVEATKHSKINKEITKYCSTKLSLRGNDLKSEENFSRELYAQTLSLNNDSIQISYKKTLSV